MKQPFWNYTGPQAGDDFGSLPFPGSETNYSGFGNGLTISPYGRYLACTSFFVSTSITRYSVYDIANKNWILSNNYAGSHAPGNFSGDGTRLIFHQEDTIASNRSTWKVLNVTTNTIISAVQTTASNQYTWLSLDGQTYFWSSWDQAAGGSYQIRDANTGSALISRSFGTGTRWRVPSPDLSIIALVKVSSIDGVNQVSYISTSTGNVLYGPFSYTGSPVNYSGLSGGITSCFNGEFFFSQDTSRTTYVYRMTDGSLVNTLPVIGGNQYFSYISQSGQNALFKDSSANKMYYVNLLNGSSTYLRNYSEFYFTAVSNAEGSLWAVTNTSGATIGTGVWLY